MIWPRTTPLALGCFAPPLCTTLAPTRLLSHLKDTPCSTQTLPLKALPLVRDRHPYWTCSLVLRARALVIPPIPARLRLAPLPQVAARCRHYSLVVSVIYLFMRSLCCKSANQIKANFCLVFVDQSIMKSYDIDREICFKGPTCQSMVILP